MTTETSSNTASSNPSGNDVGVSPDVGGNATENAPEKVAENTTAQRIEIPSDEDWKNRVKAEDAALDQKFGQEPESEASSSDQARPPSEQSVRQPEPARQASGSRQAPALPEATLAGLIVMLSNQAMIALGLIANPVTKKAEQELPLARYFIDLVAVLQQKTAGNLDHDEAAALDETVHTLRMAYVQRTKETS